MDNSSNSDESYDACCRPSPSVDQNDQSASGTSLYSTMSGDSFAYCRTNSEASNFSETIDDNTFSGEPSPSQSLSIKRSPNQAVLLRSERKLNRHLLDDKLEHRDLVESGLFA